MVFKRRNPKTWLQTIGHLFYPKGGWSRAASYVMHRLRRLPDPPHRIARGVAAGVFICFTPFFGLHFLLSAALGFVMQGNIIAALLATFFGNPLTFPFIATISLELGSWMMGTPGGFHLEAVGRAFSQASVELWQNFGAIFSGREADWQRMGVFYRGVFWPYLAGGMVPGVVSGVIAYYLTLPAVTAYQKRRVKRLQSRFEKRRAKLTKSGAAQEPDRLL